MTPEMVGHRRRLTLGKHVGRHAVRQMLADVHIVPTNPQLDVIVEKVKAVANKGKRATDADLYEIAESVMGIELNHKAFALEDIAIMIGNHVIPTASVRANVKGTDHVFSANGNGPVDAVLKAILGTAPSRIQLNEFNIQAISGGSDAIGHVTIAIEDDHGKIFVPAGAGTTLFLPRSKRWSTRSTWSTGLDYSLHFQFAVPDGHQQIESGSVSVQRCPGRELFRILSVDAR
jgi:2-isopropylmalate synthase